MIASISGTIARVEASSLVINVGGVGLRVTVPRPLLEDSEGAGRHLRLHTYLLVRETELSLYGFESDEDLNLFQLLLNVSGVGPKVSLAILSTLSPELLKNAIVNEEAAVLQRVPGIGKKTAERIMFHLRDKLDLTAVPTSATFLTDVDSDVIEALTSLGFSIVEAQAALQNIPREVNAFDERLQLALQFLDQ